MAEYLSGACDRMLTKAMSMLMAMLAGTCAHAQELADPTRPPASIESARDQDAAAASGPVLQSVLISPTRKIATINGQVLKQGDRFGDARVVKISENEVVLRNGREVQTLKLFPQVEKQTVPNHSYSKAGSRQ